MRPRIHPVMPATRAAIARAAIARAAIARAPMAGARVTSALVLLLASCREPTAPVDHLRLTVTIDRTDVVIGTPMQVRVRLSNLAVSGARTVRLHGSSTCTFGMQVRDLRGALAYPRQRACTDDLRELYLEPGQHAERTFQWNGATSEATSVSVPPGAYLVVGTLDTSELRLESAPVLIQLRSVR